MSSNSSRYSNSSRSKKNDQQPPPGSLLSGSTWRPSSGPYDTPNNVDGGNNLHHEPLDNHPGRVSGGGSSIRRPSNDNRSRSLVDASSPADPTPNSLTEPPNTKLHPRVKFRRAEEYKPQQGVDRYYGRTPNSLEAAYTTTTFRETKNFTTPEERRRSSKVDEHEVEMERRTPLERWESRRERKNKERGTTVSSAPSLRTVANEDTSAHWSPVDDNEEEEKGSNGSSSSRGSDAPHIARADASTYNYQYDDDNHYSYMQQNDKCSKQSDIDCQYRPSAVENERRNGNMNDRRPDPLGHRQSSIVTVVDTDDTYTLASGSSDIRNVATHCLLSNRANAKGSVDPYVWKYNGDDNDEENFVSPASQSSLASPASQSSLSPSNIFSDADDEKVTTMKPVNDRRKLIVSCLKNGRSYTVTPTNNGGGDNESGGARIYVQDHANASVISTPCDHGRFEIDIKPPATTYHYYGLGGGGGGGGDQGGMPEIGIPVFKNHSRVAVETPSQHSDRRHAGAIRMPRPAKDFCKRFGCEIINNDSHQTTDKMKKKYPLVALALFVVCVVIVAFTVHHIRKIDNESRYSDTAAALGTTTSSIPSVQPTIDSSMYPSSEPTLIPTTERERLISDYISSLSSKKSNEVGSPQYRAKMWILHEDSLKLEMPTGDKEIVRNEIVGDWDSEIASRIKQRFALVTLYYSMGIGDGGVAKGWLDGDECRFVGDYGQAWDGVGCDDMGIVRAVALDGANLNGTIPHEIALLSSIENLIIKNNLGLVGTIPHTIGTRINRLHQLGLNGNSFTGPIPKSIFRLYNLVYLNLADNMFTGTIDWAEASHNLEKLERLILHNNQFEGDAGFHLLVKSPLKLLSASNNLFDGVIDESVGKLQSLEYLYLDGNKLVGSIPDSISDLINLKSLNLDNNGLYGTLPHTIGNLINLEYLSAKSNALTGGLPTSMQQLTGLKTLNLASNSLSGHIRHLSQITSLKSIHLYQNSFTGSVDPQLFLLPNLEVLFLSSNSLTGELIPEVGGSQKVLKQLYLSENNFHGSIPTEICALLKLEDLFVDSNNFNGSLPLCLVDLSGLKRLYAFDNQFTGQVPEILHLPELMSLGLEQNKFNGGLESCTTTATIAKIEKMSIWADCSELDGGCACCEKCCSDQNTDYC